MDLKKQLIEKHTIHLYSLFDKMRNEQNPDTLAQLETEAKIVHEKLRDIEYVQKPDSEFPRYCAELRQYLKRFIEVLNLDANAANLAARYEYIIRDHFEAKSMPSAVDAAHAVLKAAGLPF